MSGIANASIQRDGNGNATTAFRSTSTPPTSSSTVPPPHMSIPTYASLHMDTDEHPPHQSRAQTPIIAADQQQFNTVAAQRVIDAEQQIERLQQELLNVRQALNHKQQQPQPQAQHAMPHP